jgi:gliding motility-associated-like protein
MKVLKQVIFFMVVLILSTATMKGQDSILYNSTCVGTPVRFSSLIYENIPFPTQVRWNFGDPASGILNTANGIEEPSHTFSTPGAYTVTLQVVDPSGTFNMSRVITIVNQVSHNFGPDVNICGDTGSVLLNAPVIPGALYLWTDDSTVTPSLTVTKSGTYTVKVNGCAVADTIGVYFTPKPILDLGQNHILCKNEQLTLTATNQNARYSWKVNGVVLPFKESQLKVTAPGGEHIVEIDVAGCGVYSDTVNISFADSLAPSFSLGPDTLLCPKQVYRLVASVPLSNAYNWSSMGLSFDTRVSYGISRQSSIDIDNQGRYWCFLTTKDGCEVVDTVQVGYRGDRNLNFNDTAICQGESLILNADFGVGDYKWESIPPQRDDQNQTVQSTLYVYRPGFYTITAKVGQCVYVDSLRVQFNDSLQIKLGKDTVLCIGEPYVLKPTGNALTYTWQDSTITASYAVKKTDTYTVIAQNGCGKDTVSVKIRFEDCPCQLNLPTAFTPNGDGNNDNFRPLHACNMSNYCLKIFNRFGELVFTATDPARYWSGTGKGGAASPTGTYIWTAYYTNTETKQTFQKKGSVLLIR